MSFPSRLRRLDTSEAVSGSSALSDTCSSGDSRGSSVGWAGEACVWVDGVGMCNSIDEG